jgi:hypothetical protein
MFRSICKDQDNEEKLALHIEKAGKYLFKIIYIISVNIFAYNVLKDSDFMPKELGGIGDYWNCFTPRNYAPHIPYLREYYFIGTGYHLSQLVVHMVSEKRNDFVEMALHHFVTIYLVFGSYISNIYECGAIIFFLHDFSDIFGNGAKFFGNFHFDKLTISVFIVMMGVWAWTRMYVFPYIIYQIHVLVCFPGYPFLSNLYVLMLCMLCILHYYWFSIFIRIVLFYKKKGTAEDL